MTNRLIISPSGHLYGSEQVLCDYLSTTALPAEVFVPKQGKLREVLNAAPGPHRILGFGKSIVWLYIRVAIKLTIGQYKTVYINEAGHIKYIQVLAALFKRVKFVVHVRILEDTAATRWSIPLNHNIVGISVSKYIQELLPVKSLMLHDIYKFNTNIEKDALILADGPLCVSIIGRVTTSKGIKYLWEVLEQLQHQNRQDEFVFRLFGDLSTTLEDVGIIESLRQYSNIHFEGFESNKDKIYAQSDLIFHCSTQEPLGRIFIESVNYLKPFVGFNRAGIGEIGVLIGLSQFLLNPGDPLWPDQAIQAFSTIKDRYKDHVSTMVLAKNKAEAVFNATHYTSTLDKILSA
jgi:glycosyltransferase involved in cell wall biosynthesis